MSHLRHLTMALNVDSSKFNFPLSVPFALLTVPMAWSLFFDAFPLVVTEEMNCFNNSSSSFFSCICFEIYLMAVMTWSLILSFLFGASLDLMRPFSFLYIARVPLPGHGLVCGILQACSTNALHLFYLCLLYASLHLHHQLQQSLNLHCRFVHCQMISHWKKL